MIKTRLTELVGLKYPIIQAGMGPYPVTSLCIAAANAGCLGLCSTFATTSRETNPIVFEDFCKQAHAETTDDDVTIFKKMFTRVFEETKESDGIFGANVMVSAEVKANAMKVMQAIKELREADPEMKRRFRVLVTTAGDPMPWANFVKEQGMIWMHVFPGVRTAARCKKAGVQVLIASGHEGGMHTAWQPVHSMTLLPDIIEKFSDENTLVCGTGGFCDGKSIAAAFAMGAGLAMQSKKVLLLDVDPQGDLTKMLGLRKPNDLPLTLGNAMNDIVAGVSGGDHPEICHHHEGFDFVPGNRTLSAVEVGLVNVMSRETVLRQYVDQIKKNYDYVLLDCRPSLGMLVINALSASDYVLIPVQAEYFAAENMTELVSTVQSIKRQINPKLKIGGVFMTMANETNFRKDIVASVKDAYGKHLPIMQTVIPATVRLAEISTADHSIFKHEPKGRAAEAYRTLVKEVMDIGEKQRSKPSDISR